MIELVELPEDFFSSKLHRDVHLILKKLWVQGEPIDISCVHAALRSAGKEVKITELVDMTTNSAINFQGNIQILQGDYLRRKIRHEATLLVQQSQDPTCEPESLVATAVSNLQGLLRSKKKSIKNLWEVAQEVLAKGIAGERSRPGIPTGFSSLDRSIGGGFRRGTLSLLAGRPGMGKSAAALQWAVGAAREGHKVLFFSLEMPVEALVLRLAAAETGLEPVKLQNSTPDVWADVDRQFRRYEDLPLWICDDASITAAKAVAVAKLMKAQLGLDFVVLDYLQRMSDTITEKTFNRNQLLGAIAKSFANLGRQADCAVLLLSQLSRRVDSSSDKRPTLADLRDSGELEQDADIVMALFRPHYYDQGKDENKAELLLLKNREGPRGTQELYWNPQRVRFYEMDWR